MTPIRALLVEDDDVDAMLLEDQARHASPHGQVVFDRVATLAQAVERINGRGVDVVLLDLGLPDSQGLETLARLQAQAASVAVVVLTGNEDEEVARSAMEAGAQDFLSKGQLTSVPLAQLLRHAVERHRLQEELEASETRFRTLVELADDALSRVRISPEFELEYVSPGIEAVTGRSAEELLADPGLFTRRVHPDDLAAWRDVTPLRRGEAHRVVYRWRRHDESWAWLEDRRTPILEDGALVAVQSITRDLSPIKRAELALEDALGQERAAVDKLRALDDLKSTFLQAVSHELRTPLTVIQGFALTLEQHEARLDAAQRSEMLGRLAAAADRLQRLLSDLLDVDRLNRGLLDVERRPVRILELVTTVLDDVERDSHRVLVTCPTDLEAPLDGPKVERIIENLVQNAIKHTPVGTQVQVEVTDAGDHVRIAVTDDGPGVDSRDAGGIFEPFSQGRHARHDASPGTGIGLALVARFAELHGGRAWLDPARRGGASFLVELPKQGGPGDASSLPGDGPGPREAADPPSPTTPPATPPESSAERGRVDWPDGDVDNVLAASVVQGAPDV